MRLFALDQNFPQPIVDGLGEWFAAEVELVPVAHIDWPPSTTGRSCSPSIPMSVPGTDSSQPRT